MTLPGQGLGLWLQRDRRHAGAVCVGFDRVHDGRAEYEVRVQDAERRELGRSVVAVPLAELPDPGKALRLAVLDLLELVPGEQWPTGDVRAWVAAVRDQLEAAVARMPPSRPDQDAELAAEVRLHLDEAERRAARDPVRYGGPVEALAEIRREHLALDLPTDLLVPLDLARSSVLPEEV